MASETFEQYSALVGERAHSHGLEQACKTLDQMPCTDLLSLLTVMSNVRSKDVDLSTIIKGNRFHQPSAVSQRSFHMVESEIFDALPNVDFVDLSPLQPFGTNAVLAGTNEKNVVAALRRSEVNADATSALFRLALGRLIVDNSETVRFASNVRTTRAQVFDPKTKFLPHFKVFAEVSVGKQGVHYGERELETLADHLSTEVDVIHRVSQLNGAGIKNIHTTIGNVLFAQDMIDRNLVDETEVRRNTSNPSYNVLEQAGIDAPKELPFNDTDLTKNLKELGFRRGARVMASFQSVIQERYPKLLPGLVLDLGRIAGLGYYKHTTYKINAENNNGLLLPLSDGGTTNWAENCTNNKQLFCVSSGIGTELLCNYFFDSEKA